jgi:UDP:flavonoid glycosyltransferase YjiC (YdhE family)
VSNRSEPATRLPRSTRGSLRVDWVAPPFAGHLFPILMLASDLARRGFVQQRVLCTPGARDAVEAMGLTGVALTSIRESDVFAIANSPVRVGGSPVRLLRQLRQNLSLCVPLCEEISRLWHEDRPDIVIADFTMPFVGHLAESLGARWWTTMPTPCALETRTGTPSYLGGWRDHGTAWSRLRDRVGNFAVRQTKRAMSALVRSELRALGIHGIHRPDGTEQAYSAERIFALGAREFELPRHDWPAALEFIGPIFASPPRSTVSQEPVYEPGRVHVLISLGTHLEWAKQDAIAVSMQAARALPEWRFHFTLGRAAVGERLPSAEHLTGCRDDVPPNWRAFDYIPYDERLANYNLALIHAGTGIAYACLSHAVPMVTWPQDYDQFDHAVRLEALGVAVGFRRGELVAALQEVQGNKRYREQARRMQETLATYDPASAMVAHLDRVIQTSHASSARVSAA